MLGVVIIYATQVRSQFVTVDVRWYFGNNPFLRRNIADGCRLAHRLKQLPQSNYLASMC